MGSVPPSHHGAAQGWGEQAWRQWWPAPSGPAKQQCQAGPPGPVGSPERAEPSWPKRASKPHDPVILLLIGNFVACRSSLRTTERLIIRCGLCMVKERNAADTRRCGL
ncbi:hypothetical protein TURU_091360 [Turdus rufiventris]|nr:hypothetical protein TURU_091360 [Turdus rufiventris]